ncbi:Uncharacterised protein [Shigella sonnei]|nr:Uncharacterised protein [Shigella sonnei]CSR49279.1 Uncharacterised protein [Shigella sonnei]
MIPDRNHQHITNPDTIFIVCDLLLQLRVSLRHNRFGAQLINQSWRDGIDIDHFVQVILIVR